MALAFTRQQASVPTAIGRIDHVLKDTGAPGGRTMTFNLDILNQAGDLHRRIDGDEEPYLEPAQATQLRSFMSARRSQMADDLGLPAGHTVGRIIWRFHDGDGTNPSRSLKATVAEYDDQGMFVKNIPVNDQDNMSGPQVTAAVAFLDAQRAKAVGEIL